MLALFSNSFPLSVVIDEISSLAICKCEFSHKDLVKSCGFKWNPDAKTWFMPLAQFRQDVDTIAGRLRLCATMTEEWLSGKKYTPPMPAKSTLLDYAISRLNIRPYDYQIDGINFALQNPYAIIGDAMGIGKTLQGIGVLAAFDAPALIICPAFLKYNWQNEINKFLGSAAKVIPSKGKESTNIHVINYEIMEKYEDLFSVARHWIIDEAHALKNPTSKRTQTFMYLLKKYKPETCTFLTGTAITNSIADFYTLISFCCESPKPNGINIKTHYAYSSPLRFAQYFAHERQTNFGTKFIGLKNWPELRQILEHKYLRRSAEDYIDLPPLTRSRFLCHPSPKALAECDAGLMAAYQKMQGADTTVDAAITSAKRGAATLKAPHSADLAQSVIDAGEKVIIFSDHTEPVDIIVKALGSCARAIVGATPMPERQRIVDAFQADTDVKAIVATYGALATGVTLTAAAQTIANDLPWVPSTYLQAEKRFHRIGQTQRCHVWIVTAPGYDTMIARTILQKALTLTAALSGGKEDHLDF